MIRAGISSLEETTYMNFSKFRIVAMRRTELLLVVCMLVTCASRYGRSQVKADLTNRVIEISPVENHSVTATTFLIDGPDGPRLVTARHVFESLGFPSHSDIYLLGVTGLWQKVPAEIKYGNGYDVAVLEVPLTATYKGVPMCAPSRKIEYDQNLEFFGFPFGMVVHAQDAHLSAVVPFVKHATLSGMIQLDSEHHLIVLDANNNPGFSGGPLLLKTPEDKDFGACLFGVTSGFINANGKVLGPDQKETGLTTLYNSGLMFAVPAQAVTDLLEQLKAPKPTGRVAHP